MLGGVACVSCHVMCHVIMRVGVCMRTRVYARMHMLVRVHVCMCVCVSHGEVSHVGWFVMCLMSCDMPCNHVRGRMHAYACVSMYAYARACARVCTWHTRMHACACVCVAHGEVSHAGWCVKCLMSCDMLG